MNGSELAGILRDKGVTTLFHANSVETSCTFLKLGGLASRAEVVNRGMKQTEQSSDTTDKEVGIWGDIFLDTDDWHRKWDRRNYYGPVLFQFGLDVLESLPSTVEVRVTKTQPYSATSRWYADSPDSERWLLTPDDTRANLRPFHSQFAVVIRDCAILQFPSRAALAVLDNPKRDLAPGVDAFVNARKCLTDAAEVGNVGLTVTERVPPSWCSCVAEYRDDAVATKMFLCGDCTLLPPSAGRVAGSPQSF